MEIKFFLYVIIVLSAVFHEYAHAWVAYRLGDKTAKEAGRLTLNPMAHIDIFGTVVVPLLLLFTSGIFIGWAKPVPYNPYNLTDKRYGSLKVGVAGPAANLVIAVFLGIVVRILSIAPPVGPFWTIFVGLLAFVVYVNIFLAIFNLLPFPPLDGSKVFADLFPKASGIITNFGFLGLFAALLVAFWILPPLADFIFQLIVGKGPAIF